MTMMVDLFWKEWHLREKQLKKKAPKCTCGKKNPDKSYHNADCVYLQFWNEKFIDFKDNWKRTKSLVEFI